MAYDLQKIPATKIILPRADAHYDDISNFNFSGLPKSFQMIYGLDTGRPRDAFLWENINHKREGDSNYKNDCFFVHQEWYMIKSTIIIFGDSPGYQVGLGVDVRIRYAASDRHRSDGPLITLEFLRNDYPLCQKAECGRWKFQYSGGDIDEYIGRGIVEGGKDVEKHFDKIIMHISPAFIECKYECLPRPIEPDRPV